MVDQPIPWCCLVGNLLNNSKAPRIGLREYCKSAVWRYGLRLLTSNSDVPAVFYSFSFAQNPDWSSFHPPGREIVKYYHEVCQKYRITDKIECNTDVEGCKWLEDEQ